MKNREGLNGNIALGLVEVDVCPVCGSAERDDFDGMAARKTAGRHYLMPAAKALKMSLRDLVESFRVVRCCQCGCFYCDPWLSPELASYVFCSGAPDHIAGWANFEQWMIGVAPSPTELRNHQLYDMLRERIGSISAYAEFGCPFQGFLLSMRGEELRAPRERRGVFASALKRQRDVRWSRYASLYFLMEDWVKKFILWIFLVRTWMGWEAKRTDSWQKRDLPIRRCFLTEDTSRGWGSNCVRYGASCRYFTQRVLAADVLPLAAATANSSSRFDLIGIFNYLDHTISPAAVVRECLELAPNLLIVTHRASQAGRQHLFAFGDDFAKWISQCTSDAVVTDLSACNRGLSSDYLYILISKKSALESPS